MQTIKSIASLKKKIRGLKFKNRRIGFVPTMGALHKGHLSLIQRCRRENNICVVSIFVNPTQFGPAEDFSSYPRQEKKDKLLAKKENVDIIFYPSIKNMYPDGYLTTIEVAKLSTLLCGKTRPGHFKGVATVVGKLLNLAQPDVLYLGQKDAQQAVIIKRMVTDLNFPVQVKICPTVREGDGLAFSSRNEKLTQNHRKEAVILYRSLKEAKQHIKTKKFKTAVQVKQFIKQNILRQTSGNIDYIVCVDGDNLQPLKRFNKKILIALAVKFGKVRLIDNVCFQMS